MWTNVRKTNIPCNSIVWKFHDCDRRVYCDALRCIRYCWTWGTYVCIVHVTLDWSNFDAIWIYIRRMVASDGWNGTQHTIYCVVLLLSVFPVAIVVFLCPNSQRFIISISHFSSPAFSTFSPSLPPSPHSLSLSLPIYLSLCNGRVCPGIPKLSNRKVLWNCWSVVCG